MSVNDTATSAAPVTPTIVKPRADSRFMKKATGDPTDEVKNRLAVALAETGCIPAMMSNRPNSLTVNAPPKFEVHAMFCSELSSIPDMSPAMRAASSM